MKNVDKYLLIILATVMATLAVVMLIDKVAYDKVEGEVVTMEQLMEDNAKLESEIESLYNSIYNIHNKIPYEVTIELNGETITYWQDKFGIFDKFGSARTGIM